MCSGGIVYRRSENAHCGSSPRHGRGATPLFVDIGLVMRKPQSEGLSISGGGATSAQNETWDYQSDHRPKPIATKAIKKFVTA